MRVIHTRVLVANLISALIKSALKRMGEDNHLGSPGGGAIKSNIELNEISERRQSNEHEQHSTRQSASLSIDEPIPLPSKPIRIFQSINLNMASVSLVSSYTIIIQTYLFR